VRHVPALETTPADSPVTPSGAVDEAQTDPLPIPGSFATPGASSTLAGKALTDLMSIPAGSPSPGTPSIVDDEALGDLLPVPAESTSTTTSSVATDEAVTEPLAILAECPATASVAHEDPADLLPIPPGFAPLPLAAQPQPQPEMAAVALAPVPVPSYLPEGLESENGQLPAHLTSRRQHERTRARLDDRKRERWVTVATWVRNIGAIILLFTAWQLWGTAITQHHSQTALAKQFEAKVPHVATKPGPGFTLIPTSTQLADPPHGTVIAQSQFVVSGTGVSDLALGPGHYLGTAQPGQAGNVAIAGHRTTHGAPFNRLADLSVGDPIYLTTTSGHRMTYIVSATPVPVSPTDVTVLNNFGDNRLTLTTCNPEFSARERLIVVAAYLPPGAVHPGLIAKGKGDPYKLGASVSTGWAMSLAPLVLILVGLLVALGLFNRRLSRIYGREGRWLILIPIWLALLLALFEVLTDFLPASV
jgi:sortase A